MRTGVFNFLAQERVHFGLSAAEGIAAEVAQRGAQRLFVVTSRSLNRLTAVANHALAPVQAKVVGLFDECIEHTPRDTVLPRQRQHGDRHSEGGAGLPGRGRGRRRCDEPVAHARRA